MTTYGGVLDSDSVELFRCCLDRIATALETQNRLLAKLISDYALTHRELYLSARDSKDETKGDVA